MKTVLYTFPHNRQQGQRIAEALDLPCAEINVHHFPDKESLVTLPAKEHEHVILYLSLDYPNNKLIELLFACKTARQQGIKRISLVAPYLSYMRQDTSFHVEEAVSQRIIGQWLSELVDDLITVDPHLHRTASLDEVIPNTNNIVLTATQLLGEFITSLKQEVHLLGPDEESLQWVKQVAQLCGASYSVATKTRLSDTHVEIELPAFDSAGFNYRGQHVIQIDDVISTGNTVAQTAKKLYSSGAKQVDVLATHALFTKDAMETLTQAKIKNIWSSDSITHSTNHISLTGLLATSIQTLL
jgi:ribose-phosphate pyrophosphokinase